MRFGYLIYIDGVISVRCVGTQEKYNSKMYQIITCFVRQQSVFCFGHRSLRLFMKCEI